MISAGVEGENKALISIDGKPVEYTKTENPDQRGLHIVVINSVNGKIKNAQVFDTHTDCEELDDFIFENTVEDGFIVLVACKEDCT